MAEYKPRLPKPSPKFPGLDKNAIMWYVPDIDKPKPYGNVFALTPHPEKAHWGPS